MDIEARRTRRDFLVAAGTVGAGLLLTGCAGIAARPEEKKLKEGEAGITPTEGLMRQHGVLERVLLIYEEGARRIETDDVLLPENIADAATVVRAFIKDFHEGQEESVVFLPLEKAGTLAPLTAVLRAQHKAGHGATDEPPEAARAAAVQRAGAAPRAGGADARFRAHGPAALRARGHGGVPGV